MLDMQTVNEGEYSALTDQPTDVHTYYVAVSNDENCPTVETVHNSYKEVRIGNSNGESVSLAANDSIGIFDTGGMDGDYGLNQNGYCYFSTSAGSRIRIHFNHIQLENNSNTYLRLRTTKADGSYENKYIYGTVSDTDFVTENNSVYIYFYNSSQQTAAGWDGYICAITPHTPDELAAATITFTEPTFSQQVTTSDVDGCYGSTVSLVASNGGGTSRYVWYDENYNFLKDTIGEYGTLEVPIYNNSTYYANASATNECPVLPPHYGAFLFNEDMNNETTTFSEEGEAMEFYDAAGPDANYNTPGADWTHTFVAPAGKQVTLQLDYVESISGHRLYIYDGTSTSGSRIKSYSGGSSGSSGNITSTSGALTVRWWIYRN